MSHGGDDAPLVAPDPWRSLRARTPANIAIGRVGTSLPTAELLRFGLAHARARDAVHVPLDVDRLAGDLAAAGFATAVVASAAIDRGTYLRRPDLGRILAPASAVALTAQARPAQTPPLCIVVGDGLSAIAVQTHAVPLLVALRERAHAAGAVTDTLTWFAPSVPVMIATQARVALADEIGERLGARMVVILIGERPGLSSPDSLGIYATWAPRVGRTDAERNCISNVRAEGLSYRAAAHKLAWLIEAAFARKLTGIALKDESDLATISAAPDGWTPPPT